MSSCENAPRPGGLSTMWTSQVRKQRQWKQRCLSAASRQVKAGCSLFDCIKGNQEQKRETAFHNRDCRMLKIDGYYIGTLKSLTKSHMTRVHFLFKKALLPSTSYWTHYNKWKGRCSFTSLTTESLPSWVYASLLTFFIHSLNIYCYSLFHKGTILQYYYQFHIEKPHKIITKEREKTQ